LTFAGQRVTFTQAAALPPPEHRSRPHCPVCTAGSRSVWARTPEIELARCADCGVVYRSREVWRVPPPERWEESYFHGHKAARDSELEREVRRAGRLVRAALQYTEAKSLLDVGCSFGYGLEAARRLGLSPVGLDASEYALRVCRERGYSVRAGSLDALPFDDGAIDVVLLRDALAHTAEPRRALAELARVTSARGVLVLGLEDANYLGRRRSLRADAIGRVYYSAPALERLLESGGFGALRPTRSIAGALRLRRNLFVVAQKVPCPR
jgi:SAM-dependent methyltransferase